MPLACIVEAEGGSSTMPGAAEQALEAAREYARKCEMMGGRWCRENTMTGRREYLYLTSETVEEFEKCWAAREEHFQETTSFEATEGQEGVSGKTTKAGKGGDPPKDDAVAKRARKGGKGEDPPKDPPTKKPKPVVVKSPFEKAVSRAIALKKDIQLFQSQFHHIVEAVAHDKEWRWATKCTDDLLAGKENVDENMTAWGRTLLCMELRDMKAAQDDKEFITSLVRLEEVIAEPVAAGIREVRMLLKMHQGRKSA